MTAYKLIQLETGEAIRFTIKRTFTVYFLLVMTNFKPLTHPDLLHVNWLSIEDIKQIDSVGNYDDNSGYVIYRLNTKFDTEKLLVQIENQFKNYFEK